MWREINSAPFNEPIELAVLDGQEEHTLILPCRRVLGGWVNVITGRRVTIDPTHWPRWSR
jgi:hypothetical protein